MKKIKIISFIFIINIVFFLLSSNSIAADKGAVLKSDNSPNGDVGASVKAKIRVTLDVFPYLKIAILNPNITWYIKGGVGEKSGAGSILWVISNCPFDIKIEDVDNLINKNENVEPNYNTGANILETWFATSDTRYDNPFEVPLPPNKTIVAGSNDPLNPNRGTLESDIPMQFPKARKFIWNKIRVEGNDKPGRYLDPDGYTIIIHGHI